MNTAQITSKEAVRRLPSLNWIDDQHIRAETCQLSRFAPEYFWQRPGSVRGYHNAHERGLWAHTLKLSTVIDRLADSWVRQGYITETDVDRAHAAAILHDQRKAGATGGQTAQDHDIQMARVVRGESKLTDRVASAIESHMGPWYDGSEPTAGSIEDLVHVADMIASAQSIAVHLPEPVPDELESYTNGRVSTT